MFALSVAGAWLAAAAPGVGAAADSAIAIGLLLPSDEAEARSLQQGAELAVERANAEAGVRVSLVTRGQPGQWGTEGNEAVVLAFEEGVVGLITSADGSAAHQILQVAGRTRMPVVSLCPDTSVTGAGVPWAVRVVPTTIDEARSIFAAVEATGAPPFRWAAVVPPERPGREIEQDLRRAALDGKCMLLPAVHWSEQAQLQSEFAAQVLNSKPDGVLLWMAPRPAGELARALRQGGFSGRLAGPSRLSSPAFLERAGAAAEGVIVARGESDHGGAVAPEFNTHYCERFGHLPDASARAAHDATLVLIHGLRGGPPMAAFRVLPPLTGATGVLKFDAEGNRLVTLIAAVCEKGVFRPF